MVRRRLDGVGAEAPAPASSPLLPPASARLAHLVPDLASYDVIEISSSGGKDSLAMKMYVAGLLRERGLLERGVVVHADLGRFEWPDTPALVEAQTQHLGIPWFVTVKRPQGDLLQHIEKLGQFPLPSERFCTSDHKRGQIIKAFTALADEVRATWPKKERRPVRILNCIGLRAEESPGRASRPALTERDERSSSGRRHVDIWLPIQDWTEAEVWAACRGSGAPIHPAYAAGFPRASCRFCIYMPEKALRRSAALFPDLAAEYVAVEQRIGHTFQKRLPIAKVVADVAAGADIDGPIESWCM